MSPFTCTLRRTHRTHRATHVLSAPHTPRDTQLTLLVARRLSDEILISVFSNLDMMDLRNAGQVSQLFRRVSHDKTLWPILTGERGTRASLHARCGVCSACPAVINSFLEINSGAGGKKKLDIAFCVDNTGSMGTYIKRYRRTTHTTHTTQTTHDPHTTRVDFSRGMRPTARRTTF